ncbi:MAG: hypothetical protein AAGI34_08125 [Pseudomonadota bacterium]
MRGETVEGASLPLALAAVSVDGRCRERNPSDLAIFGTGDRLVQRFTDPAEGQAMLARCAEVGTAEGVARLRTEAGAQTFRISLWRQRGGERIRILAAFAGMAERAEALPLPGELGAYELLARALRGPVEAVLAFAARLRGAPEDNGSSAAALLIAGWRLSRLCDDFDLLAEMRRPRLPLSTAEVDPARLMRRVCRLAEPLAERAGVELDASGVSREMAEGVPAIMTDESALWALTETLLHTVLAQSASGERIALGVSPEHGGVALTITHSPASEPGGAHPDLPKAALLLSEACGARLESLERDGERLLRVLFAADRCL